MGIFDKLIKKSEPADDSHTASQSNADLAEISDGEKALAEREKSLRLTDCVKVSFGEIAALGAAFAQMIPGLRTVQQTITIDGTGLYRPVNMKPFDVLKTAKDGLNWGAHVTPDGNSIMTKWQKAGALTANSSTTIRFDPTTMMMMAVLANIDKKLDAIQETQKQILSFLEMDKQAELQGDLNTLSDMMTNYKFNWDNDQYKSSHHQLALDIKRTAEKNVVFYQTQIEESVKELPSVYFDRAVNDKIAELQKKFKNYRMAQYLFAYSSFLEILLLGNFQEDYLKQVSGKVREYADCYQKLLNACVEHMKKFSSSSIETQVLGGIGAAGKALGKLIASSSFLGKGSVDEWLIENGSQLENSNLKKIEAVLKQFAEYENSGSDVFVESIQNVDRICNHTFDILSDGENLYLATD